MPDFRGTSRRLEIDVSPPLYILAWYNCKGKDEIVRMMDQSGLRYCLINVNLDTPLFYRDEELIADNVFDIYFYLYHKYF